MLSVRTAARFRKSLKKISRSGSFDKIRLEKIIDTLSHEEKLDRDCQDHALTADMSGYRECHLEFDLLLIYKVEDNNLVLVNIGSHPELFG
ncbi:type II toxin-antitoxin system YafQ family toxin [Candidatus Kaiserbacteria bacterium]|nr:type II toxin-antitoxin system YafQ family toxin [Candidatus Kaiserbacteria bacterium]